MGGITGARPFSLEIRDDDCSPHMGANKQPFLASPYVFARFGDEDSYLPYGT